MLSFLDFLVEQANLTSGAQPTQKINPAKLASNVRKNLEASRAARQSSKIDTGNAPPTPPPAKSLFSRGIESIEGVFGKETPVRDASGRLRGYVQRGGSEKLKGLLAIGASLNAAKRARTYSDVFRHVKDIGRIMDSPETGFSQSLVSAGQRIGANLTQKINDPTTRYKVTGYDASGQQVSDTIRTTGGAKDVAAEMKRRGISTSGVKEAPTMFDRAKNIFGLGPKSTGEPPIIKQPEPAETVPPPTPEQKQQMQAQRAAGSAKLKAEGEAYVGGLAKRVGTGAVDPKSIPIAARQAFMDKYGAKYQAEKARREAAGLPTVRPKVGPPLAEQLIMAHRLNKLRWSLV